jgi:hypothetical protein
MNLKSLSLLLLFAVFMLVLVGCGGGGQPVGTPTPLPAATFTPMPSSATPTTTATQVPPTATPSYLDTSGTPVTATGTPALTANTPAPTKAVDATDPEQLRDMISQDPQLCETASELMTDLCVDRAAKLIKDNPAICDTATGMMAYMCQNRAPESGPPTQGRDGHSSGSGTGSATDSGEPDKVANPCDKVAEAFRPQCEESIKSDPNSPFYDASSGSNFAESFDPDNIPQIAKANFTELDKFSRMSKLRSVVGHDYSFDTAEFDPDGLSCRSMKHYFVPAGVPRENMLYASTPHTFEWMSIKFFAPTDGVIQNVHRSTNEYGTEAQFAVTSNDHPGYLFNYYHVKLLPDLDTGSAVTAGQQIGTLGTEEAWGEIGVQVQIGPKENYLLSFLQVATDEVLEEYKVRGLNTVSDVIITREQRDANPIGCEIEFEGKPSEARWFQGSGRGGTVMVEAFAIWAFESTDNWFFFD